MAGKIQSKKFRRQGHLYKVDMFIGAVTTNWTLYDQIGKIEEELDEVKEDINYYFKFVENNEIDQIGKKWDILEECCDVITATFTLAHMIGFNHHDLEDMMEHVVNKNIDRGYLDSTEEPV